MMNTVLLFTDITYTSGSGSCGMLLVNLANTSSFCIPPPSSPLKQRREQGIVRPVLKTHKAGVTGKMTKPKNGFRSRYKPNQLYKFVKNAIISSAKC